MLLSEFLFEINRSRESSRDPFNEMSFFSCDGKALDLRCKMAIYYEPKRLKLGSYAETVIFL